MSAAPQSIWQLAKVRMPAVAVRSDFEERLPIIRGLLAMQKTGLLVVWIDEDLIRIARSAEDPRKRLSWKMAGELVRAWNRRPKAHLLKLAKGAL